MKVPVVPESAGSSKGVIDSTAALVSVLSQVRALNPNALLSGVSLPAKKNAPIVAYVDIATAGDFSHRDIHSSDTTSSQLLTT